MKYPFENKEKELLELVEKQIVETYGTSISIPFHNDRILDITKNGQISVRSSITDHPIGVDRFIDFDLQQILEIIKDVPEARSGNWNICVHSYPLSSKRREGFDGFVSDEVIIKDVNGTVYVGFFNIFKMNNLTYKHWFRDNLQNIDEPRYWTNIPK